MKSVPWTILGHAVLLFFLYCFPQDVFAGNERGLVCLGPNRMFAPYTKEEEVWITIGDSEKFAFMSQGEEPRAILNNLDTRKVYTVKVHFGETVTHSWKLDFRKYRSKKVRIWRSPGYWKMEEACGEGCSGDEKCAK